MKRNLFLLALCLALPARAVWIYDSGTSTIAKNGTSINVGVWSGKKLSIVDNRNRPELVEIDLSDGIEDASGNQYTIQQINGKQGFQGCANLRRFVMPAETTSVGENNFKDCTSLGEFVMGASCSAIGWNCFNGATSLTNFVVPANSPLTTLNPGSFINCTSLTNFPFANCPNLATINNNAFNGAGLRSADLSPCTKLTTFGTGVFQNCTALASVVFPNDCKISALGDSVFKNCPQLTSVDLSVCSNLTSIAASAFTSCTSLSRVDMPASLTSLAQGAFSGHGSLATTGVPMLHVWFLSCPIADSAKTPFSNMFSGTKDYTVTDADMANASVTIHVPHAKATAGSPNWNTYAGQWQALADASASWSTDATKMIFSLPADMESSTLWVTDWRKTGYTWNDAAVRVVFWDDPVQVQISGPVATGEFLRRDYTTADFSATLTAYDTDNASSATLSVVLYSDATHATAVARASATLSVLGSSASITVSGLTENTTYYAVLEGVDSEGVAGDPVDLGSFTTIWDEDVWTYYPARGTLEKGWIVVSNVTANGTSLSIAANSNKGDTEIPALDFTGGIRDGYELVAVGDSAFASCTALTNVVLPATVTTVGGEAFRYDPALLSFTAPGPVTIGNYCFYENTTITNAFIPNPVALNYRCFQSCRNLKSLGTDLSTVRTLGQEALSNCTVLEGDFVLTNCTSFGTWLFNGSAGIASAILGEGVTKITTVAFSGCRSLTNVVVQGEISAIDGSAFGAHGPYNGNCSTPGHLNIYLTNVPETFGNPFTGQYWVTMSAIDAADSTVVVHLPYYNGLLDGKHEADGTTETFARWARAWQAETLESIVARGCPATGFALPQTKSGSGYWRNDVDYNTAAYVVRLAYYTDPNQQNAATLILIR